ncbi:hypothetical protein BJX96DRAFT_180989 [Aspergillus floccosus]
MAQATSKYFPTLTPSSTDLESASIHLFGAAATPPQVPDHPLATLQRTDIVPILGSVDSAAKAKEDRQGRQVPKALKARKEKLGPRDPKGRLVHKAPMARKGGLDLRERLGPRDPRDLRDLWGQLGPRGNRELKELGEILFLRIPLINQRQGTDQPLLN